MKRQFQLAAAVLVSIALATSAAFAHGGGGHGGGGGGGGGHGGGGLGGGGDGGGRGGVSSLSRATVGNVRPNIGTLGAHAGTTLGAHTGTTLNSHTLGNRTALGGLGQTGLRLNNGAQTSLRPNIANASMNSRVTPQ